ncbi:hypothetical protein FRC08_002030, partial [Ceratobasidium sp. 394]
MPGSSNSGQVYEANLSTFRSFRATINDLRARAWTTQGDQASLVRRVQEWRKTIGHLTMWVQDVRAYYDQARPEIVCLLEYAFDSVSEVDRVRNGPNGPGMIKVSDNDFVNILLDYIRLIDTAFSPERQALYTTKADQEYLERGRVLYDGLHTFQIRLNSVQKKIRQSLSQPVSPVTSTHTIQPAPSTQAPTHSRSMSGNHSLPMRPTQQPPVSVQPQRTHAHTLPAGSMVPIQHPVPQSSFIRPLPNANPAPQIQWTQPPMQQNSSSYVPRNVQQFSSAAPTGPTISIPSAPSVPVEAASATISPVDVGTAEPDLPWGITWDELEALDRSEWDAGTANKDDPVDSAHGNVQPEGGLATEIGAIPASVPATSQHTNLQLTQSSEPPVASLAGGQFLEGRVITQSPTPTIENASGQIPAQPQLVSTPPIIPKEEARSPGALLSASPPPPPLPKPMSKLERRESLLAAEIIDIEELSDDGSSVSEPLAGTAPVAASNDIINIEDSDEEEQPEPSSAQPQAGPSNQPKPLATSPPSGLPRAPSGNQPPAISALAPSQLFEGTPAPASGTISNAGSAIGYSSNGIQNVGNESRDMDVDRVARGSSIVEVGIQLPAEDFEMANGEAETSSVDSMLKPTTSANDDQTETSPMSMLHESIKDANAISPEMLARVRQIAEGPLITWYIASDPSMSREVAKDKYKRMSDQEVYNLFLKIRPIIENLKVKAEATILSAETSVESPSLDDVARSSVSNQQSTGLKRPRSPHTATLAEAGTSQKLVRKLVLPGSIVPDVQPELPALLCA